MDFRILIVKNRLKINIDDDLKAVKKYEKGRTPLDIDYAYVETDFNLRHKSFGVKRMQDNVMIDMYGLDGVKQLLRDAGAVKGIIYHAVVFLYDLDDTGWYEKHGEKGHKIGHWTYFKEIFPGTEFIEIATDEGWDAIGDVVRVVTHELRHAYGNKLKRKGISYKDPMDLTPVNIDCETKKPAVFGKCIAEIPYYKEFEINHPQGNRSVANKLLAPYWNEIAESRTTRVFLETLNLLIKLLEQAIIKIAELKKTKEEKVQEEVRKSRLEDWATAIKTFEGWYIGSRSYRQNNPGNLRWSKYQIRSDGNFSIFPDYETGWKALIFQLQIAVDGRSKIYRPTFTLLDFYKKYAPSSDNNHPERYAQFVADKLGVSVSTEIRDLA